MRIAAMFIAVALTAPAFAADTAKPGPGADKDKLICKREVPIGSLIASRKICLTKAQWTQRIDDGNETARKMIYDNQGRPTTN